MAVLVGCNSVPNAAAPAVAQAASDREIYQSVVTHVGPGNQALVARCQQISDVDLAGDCALAAVRTNIRGSADDAKQWCPLVPDGAWRDECFFVAADSANLRGEPDAARLLCNAAGAFAMGCRRHQLQEELGRIVQRDIGEDFGVIEQAAVAARRRWAIHSNADGEQRSWVHLFRSAHEATPPIDIGRCAAVSPANRDACEEGARTANPHRQAPQR